MLARAYVELARHPEAVQMYEKGDTVLIPDDAHWLADYADALECSTGGS